MKNQPDILLTRDQDGTPRTNIEHRLVYQSSDGFEWGYAGKGPAELALNILLCFTDIHVAHKLHQQFKREVIVPMPYGGGTIRASRIRTWLAKKQSKPGAT